MEMIFKGKTKPNTNSISKPNNKNQQQIMIPSSFSSSSFKLNMIQRLNDSVSCGSCGKG
jgi:hypothetical protein